MMKNISLILSKRPSKTALYFILYLHILLKKRKVYLDIACASFKSRDLFYNSKYIGIDNDLNRLSMIPERFKKKLDSVPVFGNMLNLSTLPRCISESAISTNTFHWLKDSDKLKALGEISRLVSGGGDIFIDCDSGKHVVVMEDYLDQQYKSVKIYYYRNKFSSFFEEKFIDKKGVNSAYYWHILYKYILWTLLFIFELLTLKFKSSSSRVILIGSNKNNGEPLKEIDLNQYKVKGGILYL